MKLNKSELLERINNLNQSKPLLKEDKEIQRVASPADADALEQHEEALKQNKERKDPKNFDENVKELIKDTASEESRYRHFDVVDRKDLAKRINEAKQKGLDFKVTRGNKEGFRYDLAVLKEEFLKKDAGNPDINCAAFNKATDIGNPTSNTLGEDVKEEEVEKEENIEKEDNVDTLLEPKPIKEEDDIDYKGFASEICCWLINNEDPEAICFPLIDHLINIGYDKEFIDNLFNDCKIEKEDKDEKIEAEDKLEDNIDDIELDDLGEENDSNELHEELKVYTSTLDGFHPSLKAEKFWNEIKEKGKVKDLEEALELLFPEGIKDEALDVFLRDEEDWVRDLISLDNADVDSADEKDSENEEEVNDEFNEDDLIDSDDEDIEPIDYTEYDDLETSDDYSDDEDLDDEKSEDEKSEEKIENEKVEEEVKEEPKKELKECQEHSDEKEEDISDDKVEALANGYVNNNFKENNIDNMTSEKDLNKEIKESQENTDDEFVEISDDEVNDMMGLPKEEKEGNH